MLALKQRPGGYWASVGIIMLIFLLAYGVAETLQVPFLSGTPELGAASVPTALLIIGLLTADTLLPIPSSLVMAGSGALFGFWAGSLVSIIGNIAGFVFAYWLGQRSSPLIAKAISRSEIERGNQALQKWGIMALILTRPLPILAETTAIMTGIAGLSFTKSLVAVTAGSLPIAMLYAWAGSHAQGFNAAIFIFLALIFISAIAWKVDKGVQQKKVTALIKVQRPRQKHG